MKFQTMLVARATGRTDYNENEFQELREKIISHEELRDYIPDFIFSCRSLDQFWYYIKPKFSHYNERRMFLQDEFNPLLSYIEEKQYSKAQEHPFKYDVALSFAGEERAYVEEVANYLTLRGVKVFYDENEEARMWGVDLTEYLHRVYAKEALYCIMFISKNYVKKIWTRHEKRSALERAIKERGEYILPARFDNAEIEGLPSTIKFIDLRTKTPEYLGKTILIRLGKIVSEESQTETTNKIKQSRSEIVNRIERKLEKFYYPFKTCLNYDIRSSSENWNNFRILLKELSPFQYLAENEVKNAYVDLSRHVFNNMIKDGEEIIRLQTRKEEIEKLLERDIDILEQRLNELTVIDQF